MNNNFRATADLPFPLDFSVIDFETATIEMSSACSIGIACVKNNAIIGEFYSLVKPTPLSVSAKNFEIHGISVDDLRDAPGFQEVWADVQNIIQNSKYIIAHNAQFDMSVLHETSKASHFEIDNFQYIDSINLCSCYSNGAGNGLDTIARYFEVDNDHHHNALNDAITAANCVIKAVEQSKYKSFLDLVSKDNNVKIKQFKDLKSNKLFGGFRKFNSINVNDITATTSQFDDSHPFYGKNIVVTGEFEQYSRTEIIQAIVDVGGIVKNTVGKKTDILVYGEQDNRIVGEDGLSGKQEKAIALIDQGYNINIINEERFLEIMNKKSPV